MVFTSQSDTGVGEDLNGSGMYGRRRLGMVSVNGNPRTRDDLGGIQGGSDG